MSPRVLKITSAALLLLCWHPAAIVVVDSARRGYLAIPTTGNAIDNAIANDIDNAIEDEDTTRRRRRERRTRQRRARRHLQRRQQQQQSSSSTMRLSATEERMTLDSGMDDGNLVHWSTAGVTSSSSSSSSSTSSSTTVPNNSHKENNAIFANRNFELATIVTRSSNNREDVDNITSESIIRGTIYNDANQNGKRDANDNDNNNNDNDDDNDSSEEMGVAGAVVKLFACSTGYRVATTRTTEDGSYSFLIPSNDLLGTDNNDSDVRPPRGCYYIQYDVNNISNNSIIAPVTVNGDTVVKFTTPKNGETRNIYIDAGEEISGVDAGVAIVAVASTPSWPSSSLSSSTPAPAPWGSSSASSATTSATWNPTAMDDGWSLAVGSTGRAPPSPAPYAIVEESARPTGERDGGELLLLLPLPAETVAGSASAAAATSTTPSTAVGTLPLPDDTVVLATRAPMTAAVREEESAVDPPPRSSPTPAPVTVTDDTVAWSTGTAAVTTSGATDEDENKPSSNSEPAVSGGSSDDDRDETPNNKPGGKEDSKLPSEGGMTNDENEPSKSNIPVNEEDDIDEGILSLNATVRIAISNLPSAMDSDAEYIFETVCSEFLNDQLAYATPPIFDVECTVADQSLEEDDRRRRLRRERRSLRRGRLEVDVGIAGAVDEARPSARRMNDDEFERLLAGTFNVQGYIFAESLKEAEEGAATTWMSAYYRSAGEVRIAETNGVESSESGDDDDGETVFTEGVVAAIGVGGVVVMVLALLFAKKAGRRRNEKGRGTAAVGGDDNVRRSGGGGGGGGARKSNPIDKASTTVAARRKLAASSPSSSAADNIASMKTIPSTSPTNTTSTSASSHGSTTPTAAATAITPSARVRREVLAPAGKLGIMVANAKVPGRGPTVRIIRPGSPMEGRIRANDVIVGVNDVDTRSFTAVEMTKLMKDTAGEGRRIYVLSTRR